MSRIIMFPIINHFVKEFYSPEKDRTQSVIALAFCGTLLIVQRAALLCCTKLFILFFWKNELTTDEPPNNFSYATVFFCLQSKV